MRRPLLFLAIARAILEAVIFASVAAVLHRVAAGREPLSIASAALLCFGAALVLIALLRDARAERQNVLLTVSVVGGTVVLAVLQPMANADGLAVLTRIIGFAILGEAFVWRILSVARSITRWSDARGSAVLASIALGVAAVVPGLDGGPLPVLALLAVAGAGLALSLARSTEELDMAGRTGRGTASGRTAAGAAFVIGALAVLAALFSPALRALAATAGHVVGPLLAQIVYWVALPFGYLAAFLVPLLQPLAGLLFGREVRAVGPEDTIREQLMVEALEQTRPLVFGAIELLIAMLAVAFGIILIDRLTREQRSALPEGATLDREHASGASLRETLGALLPRRPVRRARPRDDGSTAAAVRLLYWRFLDLAERAGGGWRAIAETPGEHWARLRRTDHRWAAARPIVEAFERVRYGEEDPAPQIVEGARLAYRELASRRD